jgi:hypothetical protein
MLPRANQKHSRRLEFIASFVSENTSPTRDAPAMVTSREVNTHAPATP